MHPNNTFSLKRFGLYLRKDILDNYKMYLLVTGAMLAGACLAGFLFSFRWSMNDQGIHTSRMAPFYVMLTLFFTALVTSRSFIQLGQQEQRIDFFMIPASILEKVLTRFILTILTVTIVLNLAVYIGFNVFEYVITNFREGKIIHDIPTVFSGPFGIRAIIPMALGMQAIFFFGATIFYRFSFPKIFFSFCVFLFTLWLVNVLFINIFFGGHLVEWFSAVPFAAVFTNKPADIYHSMTTTFVPEWLGRTLLFVSQYCIIPALWVLAYFRIKDKEVQ
ncbi:hypothetical protein [Chitinophaga sp. Cy-1792]|uniref:hypothetical protein n=1 Tax=Chitinophaga sp. Cy-1792 TaxID=2608339 RepID=UPI0014201B59|nr:hypothetical protein [Chitinophaga sp. Cy-1792]NIG52964.1 hypothetical protein [Chitinophaga sp. Cy-1792]